MTTPCITYFDFQTTNFQQVHCYPPCNALGDRDWQISCGRGKAKFVPNGDDTESDGDDKPMRGKGKASLIQTSDEENDSHKQN